MKLETGPIFLFILGIVLLLMAVFSAKIFKTTRKIYERGLDRMENLNFAEQSIIFFHNPDIFIPISLAFVGVIITLVSIILFIIGLFGGG